MIRLPVLINGKNEDFALGGRYHNADPAEWECKVQIIVSGDQEIVRRIIQSISPSQGTLVSDMYSRLRELYNVKYKQIVINYDNSDFQCSFDFSFYTNCTNHRKLSVNERNEHLKRELSGVIFASELKSKLMRQTNKNFKTLCEVSLQTNPCEIEEEPQMYGEDVDSSYSSLTSCTEPKLEEIEQKQMQQEEELKLLKKEIETLKTNTESINELSIDNKNKIDIICHTNGEILVHTKHIRKNQKQQTDDRAEGMRLVIKKVDEIGDKTDSLQMYLHQHICTITEEIRGLKHNLLRIKRDHIMSTSHDIREASTMTDEKLINKLENRKPCQKIIPPRTFRYPERITNYDYRSSAKFLSFIHGGMRKIPDDQFSVRHSPSTNDDLLDMIHMSDLDISCSVNGELINDQPESNTLLEEKDGALSSTARFGNSAQVRTLPPEVERTFESFLDDTLSDQPDCQNGLNTVDLRVTEDVQELLQTAGLDIVPPVVSVIEAGVQVVESPHRREGLDTVFCIDTSASIRPKEVHQMRSSIMHIVANIEDVAVSQYLEENVAIVTFGKNTQILHHLTTDYSSLYDSIEQLEFGGSTPMLLGLLLSYIVLRRLGGPTFVSNYRISPRILLFTDGRPTDDCLLQDISIENNKKDPRTLRQVEGYSDYLHRQGIELYTVGVGQQVNFTLLEKIAEIGGGKYYKMDNTSYLANYFKYQFISGKVIKECQESERELEYRDVLETMNILKKFSLNGEDMTTITDLIENSRELSDDEYCGLPPFGTRIRITDCKGRQSREGTVVGHKSQEKLKILLDEGDIEYIEFSLMNSSPNLVKVLDYPRKLTPTDTFLPGVWVIRAAKSNESHFDTGSIFDVSHSGRLKIRWHEAGRGILWTKDTDDIHIHAGCFDFISWMYRDIDEWKSFSLEESVYIENIFSTRGTNKTRTLQLLNEQARILFKDYTVRLLEKDITLQLKRKDYSLT